MNENQGGGFDLRKELGIPGLEQDPVIHSWRVWGAFWTFCAGVLAIPEVQTAIVAAAGAAVPVAWAPVVPAILGVIWPLMSKYKDNRPVKGKD